MTGATALSKGLPQRVKPERKRAAAKPKGFYTSNRATAAAFLSGSLAVDVLVKASDVDIDIIVKAFNKAKDGSATGNGITGKAVQLALREAAAQVIRKSLGNEIDAIAAAYRSLLAGSMATEPNPAVASALNQARLQAKILEGTAMLDQAEACEVLGLSKSNPSATMSRKEERGEVLRFSIEGRAVYPLFQFDVAGRRVYPAIASILRLRPEAWSDFRVMHWLTRPHLDLGGPPAEALDDADAVVAAFKREIEPVIHG